MKRFVVTAGVTLMGLSSLAMPLSALASVNINSVRVNGDAVGIEVDPGSTNLVEYNLTLSADDAECLEVTFPNSNMGVQRFNITDLTQDGSWNVRRHDGQVGADVTFPDEPGAGYNMISDFFGNNGTLMQDHFCIGNVEGTASTPISINDEPDPPPVGTPPSPTPVPPGVCANVQGPLWKGKSGGEVAELQAFLIADGYGHVITAGATGYFGDQTFRALKLFQLSEGIPSTGYFGPLSQAEVNDCD